METDSDSTNTPERGGHGELGHVPVLLKEAIDFLAVKRGGTYLDATVGLGGHSYEIAKRLGALGHLIGFDKDPAALDGWRRSSLRQSTNDQTGLRSRCFEGAHSQSLRMTNDQRPSTAFSQILESAACSWGMQNADLVFRQKDRWTCG